MRQTISYPQWDFNVRMCRDASNVCRLYSVNGGEPRPVPITYHYSYNDINRKETHTC